MLIIIIIAFIIIVLHPLLLQWSLPTLFCASSLSSLPPFSVCLLVWRRAVASRAHHKSALNQDEFGELKLFAYFFTAARLSFFFFYVV
jgi:membrane protein implicated in regulation of membrane protease activity